MAHNVETSRYRGFTRDQRAAVLASLNDGASPEDAAEEAGVTVQSLTAASSRDGELRAALDGQSPAMQRAAAKGDFLAALTRTQGIVADAAVLAGVSLDTVQAWRAEDPGYGITEDTVIRWLSSHREAVRTRTRTRLTNDLLEHAAGLLEQGASIRSAAQAIGTSTGGLRYASGRSPRLAAALPPVNHGHPGRGNRTRRTPQNEALFRDLWADPGITTLAISGRLGISVPTTETWAKDLGLPSRSEVRSRARSSQ